MRTLIVYSTKYGSTGQCAEKLAELTGADLFRLAKKKFPDISQYDAVILGSPVYMGKISPLMQAFLNAHEQKLHDKRVGIFVLCGVPADFKRHLVYNFSFELLEKAEAKECFGGEINQQKLKFFDKLIVKAVAKSRSEGMGESDVSEEKVQSFAQRFAASAQA